MFSFPSKLGVLNLYDNKRVLQILKLPKLASNLSSGIDDNPNKKNNGFCAQLPPMYDIFTYLI